MSCVILVLQYRCWFCNQQIAVVGFVVFVFEDGRVFLAKKIFFFSICTVMTVHYLTGLSLII